MPINDAEKDREYKRQHYLNNKDKYKESVRKARIKFKQWVDEIKKDLKCVRCGENHPGCLDYHHIDPAQKEHSIGNMRGSVRNKDKFLKEIAKCEVLCSNCHRKLHYEEHLKTNEIEET